VSECDREASTMRKPWPTRAVEPLGEKKLYALLDIRDEAASKSTCTYEAGAIKGPQKPA
jgi:hypothetical protein